MYVPVCCAAHNGTTRHCFADFYSDDNAIKQFSVNEVQHLVVTYDQEYLRAWVNGVKVVEAAESSKRYVGGRVV